jgi:hypothetical protein
MHHKDMRSIIIYNGLMVHCYLMLMDKKVSFAQKSEIMQSFEIFLFILLVLRTFFLFVLFLSLDRPYLGKGKK